MELIANRYRPITTLSQGSLAEYVRAFDAQRDQEVVLKILPVSVGDRSWAERRLKQEYRLLANLIHPHVIRIWDYGTLPDGRSYLAREWAPGESLDQVIARGPLPFDRLCSLLRQLLHLLAYMHSRLLLLRDLNPRLLILHEETLTLVDLGITEKLGTPAGGAISGLLAYLPPEVPQGGILDARSDLYTLGCLAYELATGHPPFQGRTGIDLIRAHLGESPRPLKHSRGDLPEALERFVQRLLEKDPKDRYADALDALEDLGGICQLASDPAAAIAPFGYLHAEHLVGRSREVAQVKQGLEALKQGRGVSMVLSAPAGFGKSRLLSEIQQLAQLEGVSCGMGHCAEREMTPYAPFQALLRPLLAGSRDSEAGHAFARLFPDRVRPLATPLDPRLEKFRIFQEVTRWLRQASRQHPIALLIEDVHWADLASAELIDHLVHELRDVPVLVAMTFRPDELPAYSPIRQSLNEKIPVLLTPGPLASAEIAEMAESMLGSEAIAPEVLQTIERDSNGNPFFVSETLRYLIEAGWLVYRDRRWLLRVDPAEIPASESIEATILRRFDYLPPEGQALARVASVMGSPLVRDVLASVACDLPEDRLDEALEQLLEHQFMVLQGGMPRFQHDKTRDAIYASLPTDERRRCHLAIALELERKGQASPAVLSYHFGHAEDLERGTRYLVEAAQLAIAHDSSREAIEFLRQALRLQEVHHMPDSELQDDLRERIGRLAWLVDPGLTIAMLDHVLSHHPPGSPQAIELQALMGSAYSFLAKLNEAMACTESAIAQIADKSKPAYASLRVNRGIVLINRGYLDEAEQEFRQAREAFLNHRPLPAPLAWFATYATNNINMCRALRGEPADPQLATETEALIQEYRFPDLQNLYEYVHGAYASLSGRYQDFLLHHDAAMRINRKMGHPIHNATLHLLNLTLVLFERGELEGAVAECERLLSLTAQSGNQIFATYGEALLGRTLADRDRPEAQLARIELAAEKARAGKFRYQARILSWLAEVYMMLDRLDEAEVALREAYEVSGPSPRRNPYQHMVACRLLARCKRHHNQLDDAQRLLDEGFMLAFASQNLLQLGHLELEASELFQARGNPEDARMHRRFASGYFQRLDNPQGMAMSEGDLQLEEAGVESDTRLQALQTALHSAQARGVLAERLRSIEGEVAHARQEVQQARRMMTVAEFSRLLASSLRIEDVITYTLTKIHEVAKAERTVLRLYGGEGQVLLERARPEEGDAFDRSLMDRVRQEGRLFQIEEPAPASEQERLIDWRPRSIIALPLRAQNRITGILYVERSPFVAAFSREDQAILESLATYAGVAIENARLYEEMERRVQDRTAQLEAANSELEAFSYSVSHDLRAPLRRIDLLSDALQKDFGDQLPAEGMEYLALLRTENQAMGQLVNDLLKLSRASRAELTKDRVDLTALALETAEALQRSDPSRHGRFDIEEGLVAQGDVRLMKVVLENLLGNAWKFTGKREEAHIAFGATVLEGSRAYFVRDNGAGFDPAKATNLFKPFQRLHQAEEFPGTGIGLTTVKRIIHRHGGKVWAQGAVNQGATFYFTLSDGQE